MPELPRQALRHQNPTDLVGLPIPLFRAAIRHPSRWIRQGHSLGQTNHRQWRWAQLFAECQTRDLWWYVHITPYFSFSVWSPIVKVVSVARIMEIFCITRYHMKDMDILFSLVPYNPILNKWLGRSDMAKWGVFLCFSWFPPSLEICIQILIFKFSPFEDGTT